MPYKYVLSLSWEFNEEAIKDALTHSRRQTGAIRVIVGFRFQHEMERLNYFRHDNLPMNRDCLALALLTIFLAIPVVCAQDMNMSQPSANETLLAEMRDFYVHGIYPAAVVNPGDIKIEVFTGDDAGGTLVRVIQSQVDPVTGITNESVIDTAYANSTRKNNVMVPDLVKAPGTILDTTNKVVVTNYYYMGLILGGVTKDFDTTYKDGNGVTLTDLTAGNYTIRVTGLSGNLSGQVASKTVTFGLTNATLGSFRNIPNKNAITQYGITHTLRTYFDWFPGYFTDPNDSNKWYEAPGRWTPNNGIEVVNDRPGTKIDTSVVANNTMFIYNINSGSVTYGVELASILKYGLVDSPNTTFLYYDIGEPSITFNDADTGSVRTITGTPQPFLSPDRLKPVRAEIFNPTGTSYENLFDPNDASTSKNLDFDLSDGIAFTSGKEFIIYGATKPITSTVSETSTHYRYTINNRITQVNCTIINSQGNLVSTTLHDVNLSRLYTAGSQTRYNSLWEFGIEVSGLTAPGTYTVSLNGTDVSGTIVTGATSSFTVTVFPVAPSDLGGDSGDISGNPQVVIRPGARAGEPVFFTFNVPSSTGNFAVQSVTLYPSRDTGDVECIVQPFIPGVPLQITDRAVAGYESITMNWINPGAINHAGIMFSVNGAWLTEHALSPEDVVMLRYVDDRWTELPTVPDHTTGETNYYMAVTTGFSYFAIAGKVRATGSPGNGTLPVVGAEGVTTPKSTGSVEITGLATVVPTPVLTAASTPVPTPIVSPAQPSIKDLFFPDHGLPLITIVLWTVVVLIIIVAVILLRRWRIRRQNPSLFRKYD